ncbi:MAG: Holliday junction resolvase RuvX [Caldilineaceae bacterium]
MTIGKLLALDVGLARIGVAVCDPLRLAARPLRVIRRRSRREDFALLVQLIREQEAVAIICGLPLNMDGSEGPQAQTIRKWAERLATALQDADSSRPIYFCDERLSTYEAQQLMADYGAKVEEDAAAAAVILQRYLDAERRHSLV